LVKIIDLGGACTSIEDYGMICTPVFRDPLIRDKRMSGEEV
jgi:hypothetical protein